MINFAAIDFETANGKRTSVCSVGVVIVREGKITNKIYRLIRPRPNYYTQWTTAVHGLTYDDTMEADEFPEVCYNLMDVNGDGTLDNDDLFITLFDVSYMGAAIKKTIYFEENRYDLSVDSIQTWCDADTSGEVAADWNDIHNSINYK